MTAKMCGLRRRMDANAITVTIGGKAVEVCCDDCAVRLKEAHASAKASRKGEP